MTQSNAELHGEFKKYVNMTKSELTKWLQTDESKSVGIKQGTTDDKKTSSAGKPSVGHESGEMIVEILGKHKANLSDDDYAQMKRVTAYIKRHSKQGPAEDAAHSRWRYSLMNWGNDPLK